MSPQSFVCWFAGRRWPWFATPFLRPQPEQNFPWIVVPLAGVAGAAVAYGLVVGLLKAFGSGVDAAPVATVAAEFGGIVGLWVALFALVCWNQRAARLRAGTLAAVAQPRAVALVVLAPVYVVVLGLVIPWTLFSGVENVRGALRWRAVRTALQARGEGLTVAEVVPKPAPDDGNLSTLPMLADLLDYGPVPSNGNSRWRNTNAMARLNTLNLPDAFLKLPKDHKPRTDTPMQAWADAFRDAGAASAASAKDNNKTRSLPAYGPIPDGATPAQAVLAALSVADADLEAIKAAAKRPRAVFNVHWDEGFNALLPHLAHLKRVNQVLDLRCRARLETGDAQGAFDDALGAVNVARALREEPLLISQLVCIAQSAIAAKTVRRGIAAHAWSDAQLAALQQVVSTWRPIPGMIDSIRGERIIVSAVMDRWASDRRQFVEEYGQVANSGLDSEGGSPTPSVGLWLVPSGWIRNAQAAIVSYEQGLVDVMLPARDRLPQGGLAGLKDGIDRRFDEMMDAREMNRAGGFLVRALAPAVGNAVLKAFKAEHTARSTETALALERYRLAKGEYPADLAALVPAHLPTAPVDVMDGAPARYERTADGFFRLWSVGMPGGGNSKSGDAVPDWNWP